MEFVESRGLGVVLAAETGFRIASDPDTVRAPDAAFIRKGRVAGGLPKGFFPGAPIWPWKSCRRTIAPAKCWPKCRTGLPRAVGRVGRGPGTESVMIYSHRAMPWSLKSSDMVSGGELLPGFSAPVSEIRDVAFQGHSLGTSHLSITAPCLKVTRPWSHP